MSTHAHMHPHTRTHACALTHANARTRTHTKEKKSTYLLIWYIMINFLFLLGGLIFLSLCIFCLLRNLPLPVPLPFLLGLFTTLDILVGFLGFLLRGFLSGLLGLFFGTKEGEKLS